MPANATQAWLAADILIVREMAGTIAAQVHAAGLAVPPTGLRPCGRGGEASHGGRDNPLGNPALNLAPRRGARARTSGRACHAPAMANGRCMMHGGWSAGPRTAEGMARMTAARTTRGKCSAPQRAMGRSVRTLPVRVRLCAAASLLKQYLLAEMAARLGVGLAESKAPALPDNRVVLKNPDTTPYNSLLAEMVAQLGAWLAELRVPALADNRAILKNPDTTRCNSLLAETAARLGARLAAGPVVLKAPTLADNRAVSKDPDATPCNRLFAETAARWGARLAAGLAELKAPALPDNRAVSKVPDATPYNSVLAEMAARLVAGPVELKAPALADNRAILKNPDTTPYNSLLAEMAARLGAGLSAGPAELKTRVLPDNRAVFEESRHYPMQQSAGGDGGAAAGHRGGSGGAGCGANCASRPHATVCGWAGWLHGGHDGCTEGAVVAARPSPSSLRGSTSPATSGRGIAGRYPRSSDWPPGGWRLPSRSRT
jgi:hypothetical protein